MAIGTAGALLGAAAIGGVAQASAANRAANAQEDAANQDIAFQRETRDLVFDRLNPYANAGQWANRQMRRELSGGFEKTPAYRFQLRQGQNAINALAGAQGGVLSGRTLQALSGFNQGLASQEYGNYLARLQGMQGMGLNAAAGQGSAAQNAAAGVSNALAGRGNAQAAGAIGVGNAINSAIGNGIGLWQYQQGLANQPAQMAPTSSIRPPSNPFF